MSGKITKLNELLQLWQASRPECLSRDWVCPPNYVREAVEWNCCDVARVDIADLSSAHWDALKCALGRLVWKGPAYANPPDDVAVQKTALAACVGFSVAGDRPHLVLSSIPEPWSRAVSGRWEGCFAIAEFFDLAAGVPSGFGKPLVRGAGSPGKGGAD